MDKPFWVHMNNLHELTKQLDVLTWNSRSVLNALIRSAMAAGSSNGFTVNRAGESLVLAKEDIYRISNFYEKWESLGFPTGETFDELLTQENECYGSGALVTDALVKHAKVMWKDLSNKDNGNDYWITRIKTTENPKWFTNTAPIPLNIRTPIYDENLSTKTYDSYETYLFPSSYYSVDTLGYLGDGTAHTAGGYRWNFDVSDMFKVSADRVLLGNQDDTTINKISSLYKTTSPKYILEGGTNCGAFDMNAVSYGRSNMANGSNSVALGGTSNQVVKYNSGIFCGINNIVASTYSAVCGGSYNMIGSGSDSFAANSHNFVGGYGYEFSRMIPSSETETECPENYTIPGTNCTYNKAAPTGSIDGINLTASQIYISQNIVQKALCGTSQRTSAGYRAAPISPFDFKVNDTVMLYGISINGSNSSSKACSSVLANVVDIKMHTEKKGVVAVNNVDIPLGYIVTIDKDFTVSTFTDLGRDNISRGYICRAAAYNYPKIYTTNTRIEYVTYATTDSTVLGYNNISAGAAQTVVGSSNIELLRPRFIVGSGTSYIGDDELFRRNSFVSSPNYTYATTSRYIVSGVSTITTASMHGDKDYQANREYDEDFMHGIEKYKGFYAYCKDSTDNDETRAVLRVFNEKSVLAIGNNGLVLYEPLRDNGNNQTRTVWNELYSTHGSIAIHSGSNIVSVDQDEDNNWEKFYTKFVRQSSVPGYDNTITIWGNDRVGIHGRNMQLHANETTGYIYVNAYALKIRANTRLSLTAQPTDDGIQAYDMSGNIRIDTLIDSGHFYVTKRGMSSDVDLSQAVQNNLFNNYHAFISSKLLNKDSTGKNYDVAELLLPGNLTANCNRSARGMTSVIPHPIVISAQVSKPIGANAQTSRDKMDLGITTNGGYLYEQLAYLSDIQNSVGTQVLPNASILAYCQSSSVNGTYYDTATDVATYMYAYTNDPYLRSLNSSDAKFHATSTPYNVTETDNHNGKIIRANSLDKNAGLLTRCLDSANQPTVYLLDGVALNPCMTITGYGTDEKCIGVSYLAFGASTTRDNTASGTYATKVYIPNLANSYAGNIYRALCTSKFSSGLYNNVAPVDLCDIWGTVITDSNGNTAEWKPLLQNFHAVYSGGTLSIDFQLCWSNFSNKMLPVQGSEDAIKGICVNDSITPTTLYSTESLVLSIPLDPSIGNMLNPATNYSTGVSSMLYGQSYYTGNVPVYISGMLLHESYQPRYDRTGNYNTTYTYHGPILYLNMAGHSALPQSLNTIEVHLEGPVSYVN